MFLQESQGSKREITVVCRVIWLSEASGLVLQIAHARRPLVLVPPIRACALTRATLSRSQADLVLFLLIKRFREPLDFQKRTMIVSTNDNHLGSRACAGFPGLHFPDRPWQVEVFHSIL